MDVREKILEIRSTRDRLAYVDYFENRPKEFDSMMNCIFSLDEYPYKEYASWILIHISQSGKMNLDSYYPRLVDLLFKTEDQTVLRNVTRSLHQFNVTDYRESEFVDLLISFVQNYENKVALQVYSMYLLAQFIKRYPELKDEITEIIALHRTGKTAAYGSAERNFHKMLRKI